MKFSNKSRFDFKNERFIRVSSFMLPRLLSLTMPHIEKKRSTKADDEGILKRIKANLYRLGNVFL